MSLVVVNHELRSDAPDAYGLLDDIVTILQEQPALIHMDTWISPDVLSGRPSFSGRYAECHTAGCIAGWAFMLTGQRNDLHGVSRFASRLLGRDEEDDCDGLFWCDVCDGWQILSYGTPEYAEAVIKRIRRYQANHERHLRAQRLPPLTALTPDVTHEEETELVGV